MFSTAIIVGKTESLKLIMQLLTSMGYSHFEPSSVPPEGLVIYKKANRYLWGKDITVPAKSFVGYTNHDFRVSINPIICKTTDELLEWLNSDLIDIDGHNLIFQKGKVIYRTTEIPNEKIMEIRDRFIKEPIKIGNHTVIFNQNYVRIGCQNFDLVKINKIISNLED